MNCVCATYLNLWSTEVLSVVQSYMAEMIGDRRNSGQVGRHDLLSNLLEANTNSPDIEDLTDSELMGM